MRVIVIIIPKNLVKNFLLSVCFPFVKTKNNFFFQQASGLVTRKIFIALLIVRGWEISTTLEMNMCR